MSIHALDSSGKVILPRVVQRVSFPPNVHFASANDGCGKIALMKGRGWESQVIKWQTWSPYSHVALLYPDNKTIIEAWPRDGVRKKEVTDWQGVDLYNVRFATKEKWDKVFLAAESQLGKGYDYLGLLRFISRSKGRVDSRWFCSELVFWAMEEGGISLLCQVEPWQVSPGDIAMSPLLHRHAELERAVV